MGAIGRVLGGVVESRVGARRGTRGEFHRAGDDLDPSAPPVPATAIDQRVPRNAERGERAPQAVGPAREPAAGLGRRGALARELERDGRQVRLDAALHRGRCADFGRLRTIRACLCRCCRSADGQDACNEDGTNDEEHMTPLVPWCGRSTGTTVILERRRVVGIWHR